MPLFSNYLYLYFRTIVEYCLCFLLCFSDQSGAGRVTFSSRVSFMSAVSCRFFQVTYGDIDKKVTIQYSPYMYLNHSYYTWHSMPFDGTITKACFKMAAIILIHVHCTCVLVLHLLEGSPCDNDLYLCLYMYMLIRCVGLFQIPLSMYRMCMCDDVHVYIVIILV